MLQHSSSIELDRHKVLSLCLGFARVTDLLRALPVHIVPVVQPGVNRLFVNHCSSAVMVQT